MEQYFVELERRGLAERHRDIQAGRWRIARLVPDPARALGWSAAGFRLLPGDALRVADAELLAAALALRDGAATLVCPAAEQAGALLFLRLLAADLHGAPAAPRRLLLVHKVQEGKVPLSPEAERLALLVGAPLQQVVVLKQQVIDQIQRFLRLHGELQQTWETAGADNAGAPAAGLPRTLQQAKAALLDGDPPRAFAALVQFQKQPAATDGSLAAYLVVSHVLAGLDLPAGLDARTVWAAL
jgi:hypothetical protein